MANAVIKSRNDCTELQKKFLAALESTEILEVEPKLRWRWAAEQAGYDKHTPISAIIGPLNHILKDISEAILTRASIEASWTLAGAAGSGDIDPQIKDRVSAARDVLDRVVPKKDSVSTKPSAPLAILVLPTKQEVKLVEQNVEVNEDISTDQAN